MSHDELQPLQDSQRRFARSLRAGAGQETRGAAQGVTDDVGLEVYRHNVRQFFHDALALTYAVTRRRVGDDFFRQLAEEYRAAHPSRSGDLHWVGARFPDWLQHRLADGGYVWLADLARLEWACEESIAAAHLAPVAISALAAVPASDFDGVTLRLQPSLRLVASAYPVGSVWQANQGEVAGAPIDLGRGAEHCACASDGERVVVYRLESQQYAVLDALRGGASLAQAITLADVGPEVLARVVDWAFGEGLVCSHSGRGSGSLSHASGRRLR